MRVTLYVDALEPQLAGIGRYTWELCKGIERHPRVSAAFFAHNQLVEEPADLLVEGRSRTPRRRLVRGYRRWQAQRRLRTSLVHGPNFFLPRDAETGVITVHDLSVFRYPELHPAARVRQFETSLERSIDRAEHLITDCRTIRQEVIEFAGVAPERVTVVPLGVSDEFRPLSSEERSPVVKRYGLPLTGYGLTLSTLEPRKRIGRLLSAWSQVPGALRDRCPLVICGGSGWNNEALHAKIDDAVREGWVISLGFVPEADLPAIYSGASIFAYPSVYEGFGLPPLEAMACGVPTIVATGSCLPEVTNGAAFEVDPDDIDAFALLIGRLLQDDEWRNEAISAGIQVANSYTWARCVDETVAVYQQVNDKIGSKGR